MKLDGFDILFVVFIGLLGGIAFYSGYLIPHGVMLWVLIPISIWLRRKINEPDETETMVIS